MFYFQFAVLMLLMSLCLNCAPGAQAASESFELPTESEKIQLQGQLDFPDHATESQRFPLVIMVPGTGPYDRDVDFGMSGTPADLIFKNLSQGLNARGIATLRFDKRGVHCNRYSQTQALCQNAIEMLSYNPENMRADIAALYALALRHPRVDPQRVSFFAHSEGTYHVAALISAGRIRPYSLHLLGGPVQAPGELMRWQMTDRLVSALYAYDLNGDGQLSNAELRDQTPLFQILPTSNYYHPEGAWPSRKHLREHLLKGYQAFLKSLEESAPDVLIYNNSIQWWQWFSHSQERPLDLLQDYTGPLYLYWGSGDSQVPLSAQLQVLGATASGLKSYPMVTVFPRLGHGLSPKHPILGPLTPPARARLLWLMTQDLHAAQ